MSKSFKTFLKHTAKDYHNQSVNPPIVRASTIIFKSMQDIRKMQDKSKKDPTGGHFDYGRQGTSTTHILSQILKEIDNNDLIIMSAAVSDYRVKQKFDQKIKKEKLSSIDLEKNPDILAEIDNKKIVKVGFAAESENLIENAKKKLSSKDCNLIVANDITLEGSGFGSDNNKATLVHKEGCDDLPLMKKSELAHKILDRTIEYID